MIVLILAHISLIWYTSVILVCCIGYFQIFRYYRSRPQPATSSTTLRAEAPHVTVIRACKGIEPCLYECLSSTFEQDYPADKLTIYLCISAREDPAYPILQKVIADHPDHDSRIYVETDDPRMQPDHAADLGPNPKIRNQSRAYREAKGDILWLIDCNVWVGRGVAGRMVDALCGLSPESRGTKYKFVHQLPLAIDITTMQSPNSDSPSDQSSEQFLSYAGGRLEELFLASSHAKFYTAINTVLLAPCIVGKSNMFRRSHLDQLTSHAPQSGDYSQPTGIDHFSHNICEDHLIGDLLWRNPVHWPQDLTSGPVSLRSPPRRKMLNHGLLRRDPCLQPTQNLPLTWYTARRARWLRVRKFTVPAATLVEPGTESLVCSAHGAFALTVLPFARSVLNIPPTWTAFFSIWLLSITVWCMGDYMLYRILHGLACIEENPDLPAFARPEGYTSISAYGATVMHRSVVKKPRRPFVEWLAAWVAREVLALPVWTWAVLGGVTVVWRGRKFRVGVDMRVRALDGDGRNAVSARSAANGHRKVRRE